MEAPPADAAPWSEELVLRAIRRSLGLVALSYTPYFPALFDGSLGRRVRPPSAIELDPARVAAPWPIQAAGKRYFVPGRLEDLVDYTSCVIALGPAIRRAASAVGTSADCGPPSWDELQAGRVGERPWKSYWNEFHRRSDAYAAAGHPWVLNADIERCAESIDAGALARLLGDWDADADAVRVFAAIHRAWADRGFRGLPVIGTFALLTRFFLHPVEATLHRHGLPFLRSIDDFRLFCRTPDDREAAVRLLRESLAARGLRLNEHKHRFQRHGTPQAFWRRWRLIVKGKVRYGAVRPVLVRLTRWRSSRPIALAALRCMVRRPAEPPREGVGSA